MATCILFKYRNKVDVSIHYSWMSAPVLAIIRIASLVLLTIRLILLFSEITSSDELYLFLTNYGFLISWIYFIVVVVDLLVSKLILKRQIKFVGDCINMLYEIAFEIEFTLTLLYWTVLYSPNALEPFGFSNLGVHGMPLLCLFLDLALNSHQFPYRHIIATFIVAAIYILINQVHSCNVKPVYDAYQCGDFLLPLVAFVVLAVAHMFGHLVWKFAKGKKITEQLTGTTSESLLEQESIKD